LRQKKRRNRLNAFLCRSEKAWKIGTQNSPLPQVVLPTVRFFTTEIFRFFCFRLKKNLTNVYFSL
jgi:hypothetical protein